LERMSSIASISNLHQCINAKTNCSPAKHICQARSLKPSNRKHVVDEEGSEDVIKKLSSTAGEVGDRKASSPQSSPEVQPLMSFVDTEEDGERLGNSAGDVDLGDIASDHDHINDSEHGNVDFDLPTMHTPQQQASDQQAKSTPLTSPPCLRIPFAPNGPTSPIEHAFARLAASATTPSIHIPAPTPPYACDPNLDPRLLDKECNPPMNRPPLADYQLPSATINEALSVSPSVPTARKQAGTSHMHNTKSRASRKIGTTAQTTAAEKRAATQATSKATEEAGLQPADNSTRGRKRKNRLNPDGEEFVKPKKAKRAMGARM
jgi:hypothetical protein